MGKSKQAKTLAVAGLLGAVFLLSGCADYNPPVSQNKTNSVSTASNTKEVKSEDNEDVVIANKRFECKQEAYNKYIEKRNIECHKLKREDGCTMPPLNYLPLEKEKTDAMDECYKTYKSTAKFKGEDEFLKEIGREKCLNYSEQLYIDKWDSQCKRLGRDKNCTLPVALSNPLDDMRRGERDECYNKYPAK